MCGENFGSATLPKVTLSQAKCWCPSWHKSSSFEYSKFKHLKQVVTEHCNRWKIKIENYTSRTVNRRTKHPEIWSGCRGTYLMYMGYSLPFMLQCHFRVIRCTCEFSDNYIFKTLRIQLRIFSRLNLHRFPLTIHTNLTNASEALRLCWPLAKYDQVRFMPNSWSEFK